MAGDVRCSFPLFKARFLSAVPEFCAPPAPSPDRRPVEEAESVGEPGKLPSLALGQRGEDVGDTPGLSKGAVSKLNLRMLARDDAPPTEVGARRHKMAQYEKKCSKVLDGLFVGGEFPARDFPTLQANGITHVINCVGSVYPSFHAGKLSYKTLYLEDDPKENIMCVLHECFDYIDEARTNGGKVYVHCSQGVSRSATIAIGYSIWKLNKDFDVIFEHVKKIRTVVSPNMGFQLALLQWQKRRKFGVKRCYISRLAPQSEAVPLFVVPKAAEDHSWAALDSRGVFIIEISGRLFVWVGGLAHEALIAAASLIATRISRYDYTCSVAMDAIDEGQEPESLGMALTPEGESPPAPVYPRRNESYNYDFDLLNTAMPPSRSPRLHGVGGADAVWGPGRILSCEATPRTPRGSARGSANGGTAGGVLDERKAGASPVPPLPLGLCTIANSQLSNRTASLSAATATPRTAH